MTWKSEPLNQNQPLDNYESAVKDYVAQLELLRSEIKIALEQKDLLISDNAAILREKLAQHNFLIAEVEALRKDAKIKSDELDQAKELIKEQLQRIANEAIILEGKKLEFLANVQKRQAELDAQAASHVDILKGHEEYNQELEERNLELIAFEKELETLANHLNAQSNEQKGMLAELEAHIEQNASEKALLASQHMILDQKMKDHDNYYQNVEAKHAEAERLSQEAEITLKRILDEQTKLNGMIIESKRAALDATKKIERAQKVEILTNQKIAELNDLKAELSKQETNQ